ncbi:MAG: DUF5522 domain-containing protein [bacterium]
MIEGEDYYLEGDAVIFTIRFHLRRGYSCENGCRHCPYRESSCVLENSGYLKTIQVARLCGLMGASASLTTTCPCNLKLAGRFEARRNY